MNPKISIILPTFNAKKYFMTAFNSVLNQTFGFENIELIIIDDNSNDGTKDLLRDLTKKYENIRVIYLEENSGSPSKGRNIGIHEANAEHIMFLDQDDYYEKDICEKLYSAAKKYDADIVNCRIIFTKDGKNIKEKHILDKKDKIMELNSIDDDPSLLISTTIWNKIYKRSFILKYNINFANNELYEDTYFNVQAFIKSSKIISLNDYYGIYYNIRDSGDDKSTSKNFNKENLTKMYKGCKKILNVLEENQKYYAEFECIILIGFIKWILLTDCEKEYKLKLFREFKKEFKKYGLFLRLDNISLITNIVMNIFLRFISFNDINFKLILSLFDIKWFRNKLQNFHYVSF